jgi:hypothetical protein
LGMLLAIGNAKESIQNYLLTTSLRTFEIPPKIEIPMFLNI